MDSLEKACKSLKLEPPKPTAFACSEPWNRRRSPFSRCLLRFRQRSFLCDLLDELWRFRILIVKPVSIKQTRNKVCGAKGTAPITNRWRQLCARLETTS